MAGTITADKLSEIARELVSMESGLDGRNNIAFFGIPFLWRKASQWSPA